MNIKSIGYKYYKSVFELKQLYVWRLLFSVPYGFSLYGFDLEKSAFYASLDDCPF
jgi:hypothetical protein